MGRPDSSTAELREAAEALRLEALRSYGIMDTEVDAAFDDIAQIASQICEAPIALISLVDTNRQWFKSVVGLDLTQTPIETSFCAHAMYEDGVMEVQDALHDPRFVVNPLVTDVPRMRFYAGAPLRTSDGYPLGTLCVIDHRPRSLSTRQRESLQALSRQTMALMELRRTLHRAEAMQQHLRRLMVIAGHDLKQPLQTILTSLEIARIKSADATVVRQAERAIAATCKLSEDLDKLAMASGDAARDVSSAQRRMPIADVLRALEITWRPHAERKKLRLRIAPSSAYVTSNAQLLTTILGNLVGNAIKYTERGTVLVGCRRAKSELRVEVLDTGIGVAPEFQAAMFATFKKADRRSDGLGLGLSIVRTSLDLLGHELSLQSTPGRGTAVRVTLPLAELSDLGTL